MNTDADTDLHSNDLTQLSSREQLSALMDSALPADQTRFLLRRLQHDASLAECWERWRIAGEVMRGLAPAQRLPSDFASRVSVALHGGEATTAAVRTARAPTWLRWGGGMVAASLAVAIGLAVRQPGADAPAASSMQLASSPASTAETPQAPASTTPPRDAGNATQALAAVAVVATTSRSQRGARDGAQSRGMARAQPAIVRNAARDDSGAQAQFDVAGNDVQVPQPDIVIRPWPRSVLPQYANGGLTVGFGEHVRGNVPYNPFQAQMPPLTGVGSPPPAGATADPAREQAATADPRRETQTQP